MRFKAIKKNVWYSPSKLRPIVDVVRGKPVDQALQWFSVYHTKRVLPIKKAVESAVANAAYLAQLNQEDLLIRRIYIDQGKIYRYYKPGAMGRSQVLRKRLCHIGVELESREGAKQVKEQRHTRTTSKERRRGN